MKLIDIAPSDSSLWEQAWRLYVSSFPEHERRTLDSHVNALTNSDFHVEAAIDGDNLLAILFYWTFGGYDIYIEHIAVNPHMRGRRIGSSVLRDLAARNPRATIILEIDPPLDETSKRRLLFYEKLGFCDTGFIFKHPSYRTRGRCHDLLILSYPARIQEDKYMEFIAFLHSGPLKYID